MSAVHFVGDVDIPPVRRCEERGPNGETCSLLFDHEGPQHTQVSVARSASGYGNPHAPARIVDWLEETSTVTTSQRAELLAATAKDRGLRAAFVAQFGKVGSLPASQYERARAFVDQWEDAA